jgi:uncharacterized protein YndB with AHSA1/START domain
MTTEPTPSPNAPRLERTYDAPAELIWELWTTTASLGGVVCPRRLRKQGERARAQPRRPAVVHHDRDAFRDRGRACPATTAGG